MSNDAMQLFEDQPIRSAWDAEREEWYFSVVDVVAALTGSENPRRYWSDLKRKLKSEGAVELYENIVQLKLASADGKRRLTDVADTEQLLRIIQSIPSPSLPDKFTDFPGGLPHLLSLEPMPGPLQHLQPGVGKGFQRLF